MENDNDNLCNIIYGYETFLEEVKELILPTILKKIPLDQRQIVSGEISKEDFAELVYNNIMAFVCNGEDFEAFAKDSIHRSKRVIVPGLSEYYNYLFFLSEILGYYEHQVNAVKVFYHEMQSSKPYNEIIENVKKQLEPLKNEEYYEDLSEQDKKVWIKNKILEIYFENIDYELRNASVEELEERLKGIIRRMDDSDDLKLSCLNCDRFYK